MDVAEAALVVQDEGAQLFSTTNPTQVRVLHVPAGGAV